MRNITLSLMITFGQTDKSSTTYVPEADQVCHCPAYLYVRNG